MHVFIATVRAIGLTRWYIQDGEIHNDFKPLKTQRITMPHQSYTVHSLNWRQTAGWPLSHHATNPILLLQYKHWCLKMPISLLPGACLYTYAAATEVAFMIINSCHTGTVNYFPPARPWVAWIFILWTVFLVFRTVQL